MVSCSRKQTQTLLLTWAYLMTLEEKEAFLQTEMLQNVLKLMTPAEAPLLVNQDLVNALINLAEAGSHPTPWPP